MKNTIYITIIILIPTIYARDNCNDELYLKLNSKLINEMSDYEYHYFKDIHLDCDNFSPCEDRHFREVENKSISEMNDNEYDYFVELFDKCEAVDPCELQQFKDLISIPEPKMSNREFYFFDDCADNCERYSKNYSFSDEPCLNDDYLALLQMPIKDMSDYQYRFFYHLHSKCHDYESCTDTQYILLKNKKISEMNHNEYNYFRRKYYKEENCLYAIPCTLYQFLSLSSVPDSQMSSRELDFYEDCLNECGDYEIYYSNDTTDVPIYKKNRKGKSLLVLGIICAASPLILIFIGFTIIAIN